MVQCTTTRVFSEGYSSSSGVCLAVAAGLLSTSAASSAAAATLFVAAPYSSASSPCLSSATVSSCCSWRSRILRTHPLRRRARTPSTSRCLWPGLRSAAMTTETGYAKEVPTPGAAPPELVAGASDFETFFGAYRIRPRRESESLMDASWQDVLVLDAQQEGKEERARHAAALSAAVVNGDGTHAHAGADRRVLIVEDLEADGGIIGFFGALDSPTATGPTLDTYISVRAGREVDRPTTSLLTRALHGWLSGPVAAAAATRRNRLGALAGAGRPTNEEEEGELVDWVDTRGRVICALPRPVVHSNNVLHRGAGVMIRDAKARTAYGEVYCHRRTSTKRVFPSMYDMFIGGVSGTMEPPLATALRELGEELGLGPYGSSGSALENQGDDGLKTTSMRYRGECLVQTGHNRCFVSVFDYRVVAGETVKWQEDEVEWGSYVPWEEVVSKVSEGKWEFVPDGLQVWRHYLDWEAA
ncbi:unnamed protein product [Ectocarpus sp. 4 AP-2014]